MKRTLFALIALVLFPAAARAQETTQEQIQRLSSELEALKKKVDRQESAFKLPEELSKMHFHGYGDIHYNHPKIGAMSHKDGDEADVHRFVLGWGYAFSDSIRLDTEIDFEHAADEIELEYAHLDFDVAPALTIRAGDLLMPFGPLNEFHEPPLFYSVERPYVMNSVIPTTWQENGVGLVGRTFNDALTFRTYIVTGLDASKFTSLDGIRKGRTGGSESKADDLAFVGRVEFSPTLGLALGGSLYTGGADQGDAALGSVRVSLYEVDARYRMHGFDLTGVYVRGEISGAGKISSVTGQTIGSSLEGWYLEAAYNVLPLLLPESKNKLTAYLRHEEFDTNKDVPSGFVRDDAADREIWSFGLAYHPHPNVVVKADYELWSNESDAENDLGRFNLGVGYMF